MEKEGVSTKLCPAPLGGTPAKMADGSGIHPGTFYGRDATDEGEGLFVRAAHYFGWGTHGGWIVGVGDEGGCDGCVGFGFGFGL